jgi:hypothetical protein
MKITIENNQGEEIFMGQGLHLEKIIDEIGRFEKLAKTCKRCRDVMVESEMYCSEECAREAGAASDYPYGEVADDNIKAIPNPDL